jgi:ABC-type proline/glycine betaine transport system permease subunit
MDALLGPLVPFIVLGSVAWVGIAIGIGLLAERRGSSGLIWFALSIFTTPILALLLLLVVTPQGGQSGRR